MSTVHHSRHENDTIIIYQSVVFCEKLISYKTLTDKKIYVARGISK